MRGDGGRVLSPAVAQGLTWFEEGDHSVGPQADDGYTLYGVERVGLASGFKFFGKHDWYRELAARVVPTQWPNGAWGHEQTGDAALTDTAYTLLFLARGRHPVMMNKLRFEKYWINRPRDVSNLARFASRELERELNWQVVGIDNDWADWLDSPVLFIASHQPPKLTDADYAKLRRFVEAGGLLFTHADNGSESFSKWVSELALKICPGCGVAACW